MYSNANAVNSPFSQQQMQQANPMMQRQMPMGGGMGMNMNIAGQQVIQQPQPGISK